MEQETGENVQRGSKGVLASGVFKEGSWFVAADNCGVIRLRMSPRLLLYQVLLHTQSLLNFEPCKGKRLDAVLAVKEYYQVPNPSGEESPLLLSPWDNQLAQKLTTCGQRRGKTC